MAERLKFKKQFYKLGILVTIIFVIAALFKFTALDTADFTPTRIKEFILSFGIFAPIVFLIIYGLRGVIVVIPVLAMSLTAGLAFGVWWGWLLNVTGATIGSCLSFLFARYFGRGFIDSIPFFKSGRLKSFDDKAAEHGFKVILFMRFIPLFQYDAVGSGPLCQ